MGKRIPIEDRPRKHCTKCGTVTPWNTHDRCMICQKHRSKGYGTRLRNSGGPFSAATKRLLRARHPDRCPACGTAWDQVPEHSQHPKTPWHFDHIVSPQHGGTNAPENAQILCWPCNLRKLDKSAREAQG